MDMTLTTPQTIKADKLTDAFQLFNELSENLSNSYQGLEKQVATLTKELAVAQSERVKTLVEKEKLADRLQQIIAAIPAAVIVLNSAEQVVDCNNMAIDYLGEPLVGLNWLDVMQHSLLPVFDSPHERQLRNGIRVTLTRNTLNHDSGQIILLSDVSELRSLQDKLSQQKHLSAMGEMVASMAHQVRTPLSTAMLYASQMNKPALTEKNRLKFSNKILERLQYLERQVNDMLIFAKEGHLAMASFSLQGLMKRVNDNMHDLTANKNLSFTLIQNVQQDNLQGNEDALLGALMNLLNNAFDAIDIVAIASDTIVQNGQIVMMVEQVDSATLQIKIKDDGVGINKAEQQRLFEPFYTTKIKGTGLGLAVVDSVVKAHGGTIQCQSEIGEGTCFTLLMPCLNQTSITLSKTGADEQEKQYEAV